MKDYSQYSDEELLRFMKSDEESAFNEIYNRYWQKLYATAVKRLGDFEECQEIVQNVFFNLWKNRKTFQLKYSLNTYFFASIKYEVINSLGAKARRGKAFKSLPPSELAAPPFDSHIDFRELQDHVAKLVDALPEKCRLVFQLSREEGLSNQEIASKLGVAEKTVEGHITLALRRLKTALSNLFAVFLSFFLS